MRIGIASDHRGYKLKEQLKHMLDYEFIDYGTYSEESCDYPDFAFKLGEAVRDNKVDFGVAICGTGIGISIACNKVKGIRCAKVDNEEDAIYTREDNDANIVAFTSEKTIEDAELIVNNFINTNFSNLEKHQRRIDKIKDYEDLNEK